MVHEPGFEQFPELFPGLEAIAFILEIQVQPAGQLIDCFCALGKLDDGLPLIRAYAHDHNALAITADEVMAKGSEDMIAHTLSSLAIHFGFGDITQMTHRR